MTETVGIIIKADIDLGQAKLDFQSALKVMEKGGLIGRTTNGEIYLTEKGKNQQLRGFSINGPSRK